MASTSASAFGSGSGSGGGAHTNANTSAHASASTNAHASANASGSALAPCLTLRTVAPLPRFRTAHAVPPPQTRVSALKLSIVRILTGASGGSSASAGDARGGGGGSGGGGGGGSASGNVITMTYAEQVKQMTLHGWRLQMLGLELRQNALIAPETRARGPHALDPHALDSGAHADADADDGIKGFELKDEHECALLEEGDEIVIRILPPFTLADLQLPDLGPRHVYAAPPASLTRAGTLSAPPAYSSIIRQGGGTAAAAAPVAGAQNTDADTGAGARTGSGSGAPGKAKKARRKGAAGAGGARPRRTRRSSSASGASVHSSASGGSAASRSSLASNTTAAFLQLHPHVALAAPREPSSHSSSVAIHSASRTGRPALPAASGPNAGSAARQSAAAAAAARGYPLASEVFRTKRALWTLPAAGTAAPAAPAAPQPGAAKVLTKVSNGRGGSKLAGLESGAGSAAGAGALQKKRRPSAGAAGSKRRQNSSGSAAGAGAGAGGALPLLSPALSGGTSSAPPTPSSSADAPGSPGLYAPLGSPSAIASASAAGGPTLAAAPPPPTLPASAATAAALLGSGVAGVSSARAEAMLAAARRSNAALHPMYAAAATARAKDKDKDKERRKEHRSASGKHRDPAAAAAAATSSAAPETASVAAIPPASVVGATGTSTPASGSAALAPSPSISLSPSPGSGAATASGSSVTQTARGAGNGSVFSSAHATTPGGSPSLPQAAQLLSAPHAEPAPSMHSHAPSAAAPANPNALINSGTAENLHKMPPTALVIGGGVQGTVGRSVSGALSRPFSLAPAAPSPPQAPLAPPVQPVQQRPRPSSREPSTSEPLGHGAPPSAYHAQRPMPSITRQSSRQALAEAPAEPLQPVASADTAAASEKSADKGKRRMPLLRQISSALSSTNLLGQPIMRSNSTHSKGDDAPKVTPAPHDEEGASHGPPTLPPLQHIQQDASQDAESSRAGASASGTAAAPQTELMSVDDQLALDAAIAIALAESELEDLPSPSTAPQHTSAPTRQAPGLERAASQRTEKDLPPMPSAADAPTVVNGQVRSPRQGSFGSAKHSRPGSLGGPASPNLHQSGQIAWHGHRQASRPSSSRRRPSAEAGTMMSGTNRSSGSSSADKKLAGDAAQLQTQVWNETTNAANGSGSGSRLFRLPGLGRKKKSDKDGSAAADATPQGSPQTGTDDADRTPRKRPSFVAHVQQRPHTADGKDGSKGEAARKESDSSSGEHAAARAEKRYAAVQRELERERIRQAGEEAARKDEIRRREARKREEAAKKRAEEEKKRVAQQWEMWEEVRRREREAGLPPPKVTDRLP